MASASTRMPVVDTGDDGTDEGQCLGIRVSTAPTVSANPAAQFIQPHVASTEPGATASPGGFGLAAEDSGSVHQLSATTPTMIDGNAGMYSTPLQEDTQAATAAVASLSSTSRSYNYYTASYSRRSSAGAQTTRVRRRTDAHGRRFSEPAATHSASQHDLGVERRLSAAGPMSRQRHQRHRQLRVLSAADLQQQPSPDTVPLGSPSGDASMGWAHNASWADSSGGFTAHSAESGGEQDAHHDGSGHPRGSVTMPAPRARRSDGSEGNFDSEVERKQAAFAKTSLERGMSTSSATQFFGFLRTMASEDE